MTASAVVRRLAAVPRRPFLVHRRTGTAALSNKAQIGEKEPVATATEPSAAHLTLSREAKLREELWEATQDGDLAKVMKIQSQGVYMSDGFIAAKRAGHSGTEDGASGQQGAYEYEGGRVFRRQDNGRFSAFRCGGEYLGQHDTLAEAAHALERARVKESSDCSSADANGDGRKEGGFRMGGVRFGITLLSMVAIFYTYT
jgi:hypothetical protein